MASSPVSGLDGAAASSSPPFNAAVEAAEAVVGTAVPRNVVVLDSGITLRLKKVPPLAIREAAARLKRPAVPTVYMADRDRSMENPNDPDYLAALQAWEGEVFNSATNVMLLLGVEVEFVPEDVSGPDDEAWMEALVLLGICTGEERPAARKLAWLRYVALDDNNAIAMVIGTIARASGLTEQEVQQAAASFRSAETRGADQPVPAAPAGDDGD